MLIFGFGSGGSPFGTELAEDEHHVPSHILPTGTPFAPFFSASRHK